MKLKTNPWKCLFRELSTGGFWGSSSTVVASAKSRTINATLVLISLRDLQPWLSCPLPFSPPSSHAVRPSSNRAPLLETPLSPPYQHGSCTKRVRSGIPWTLPSCRTAKPSTLSLIVSPINNLCRRLKSNTDVWLCLPGLVFGRHLL